MTIATMAPIPSFGSAEFEDCVLLGIVVGALIVLVDVKDDVDVAGEAVAAESEELGSEAGVESSSPLHAGSSLSIGLLAELVSNAYSRVQ
jgi:hypothetical protein